MIIRQHDGHITEAILVSRTANSIRVAVPGAEDLAEFREINGVWISEDCEPVTIEFALAQIIVPPAVSLEDCICPPELASKLVAMLYEAERAPELATAAALASSPLASAACSMWAV